MSNPVLTVRASPPKFRLRDSRSRTMRWLVVFLAIGFCAVCSAPAAARSRGSAGAAPSRQVVLGGSFRPIRAGVDDVWASGAYLLSTIANGATQAPMLINDRIGTTTALDPRCAVDGLGGPWVLLSCAQTSNPLGSYDLELYSLADGARQTVTPGPGLPCSSPVSECFSPDAVGASWIRWAESCYHCSGIYSFENLQTGEVRDDPTNATTGADLNSAGLAHKTCPGVRLLRSPDPFSRSWGSLTSYGQFALAIGTDHHANGAAFLERCGSGTRELLASGPYEGWIPPLASNSRAIVWQAAPDRLNGLFLPSLQKFTIALPSAIMMAQGSPVASDTRVAAIALTSAGLYVLDTTGGTLWRTASPTALPLNMNRPKLTRSRSGLTCRRGNWRNASRFSYAWRVNGMANKRANKPRLSLGKALERPSVSCSVTAFNAAGTTTASSAQLHIPRTAAQ